MGDCRRYDVISRSSIDCGVVKITARDSPTAVCFGDWNVIRAVNFLLLAYASAVLSDSVTRFYQ